MLVARHSDNHLIYLVENATDVAEREGSALVRTLCERIMRGTGRDPRSQGIVLCALIGLSMLKGVFKDQPSAGDCIVKAWPTIKKRWDIRTSQHYDGSKTVVTQCKLLDAVMHFGAGSRAKRFFEGEVPVELARLWRSELVLSSLGPAASSCLGSCILHSDASDVFMNLFLQSADIDGETFFNILVGRGLMAMEKYEVYGEEFLGNLGMILAPITSLSFAKYRLASIPIPMSLMVDTGGMLVERMVLNMSRNESVVQGSPSSDLINCLDKCIMFFYNTSFMGNGHWALARLLQGNFLLSFIACSASFCKLRRDMDGENMANNLIRRIIEHLVFDDVISSLSKTLAYFDVVRKRRLLEGSCIKKDWERMEVRLLESRVWTWTGRLEQSALALKLGYACFFVSALSLSLNGNDRIH